MRTREEIIDLFLVLIHQYPSAQVQARLPAACKIGRQRIPTETKRLLVIQARKGNLLRGPAQGTFSTDSASACRGFKAGILSPQLERF